MRKKKDRTSRTPEILSRVLMYADLVSHKVIEKRAERIVEDITKILLNLMNLESSKRKIPHITYI